MMRWITVVVLLAAAPQDEKGKLVWSDEFDGDALDPKKWDFEEGMLRNNELQHYRRENARVENGMLVIEARKEKFQKAEITSASVITAGKARWTYGRFEIRAKLPAGRGTWPAIWLLGDDYKKVGWPRCGEIDIMENVGFDPDMIHANIHCGKYNHVQGTHKGAKIEIPRPYDAFHVYSLEWRADRLDFFVDDKKYFTFAKEPGGEDVWPYDRPHYLLLNLAIGGNWGGQKGVDDAIFPQKFLIDYVRIYQKE